MSYKSLNGLMRHLRNQGIDIRGTTDKRLLRNSGYFHGYKGYRFFKQPTNRLVNDTLRMYKNDDIRMYNFDCITDTIVEVITTCNTYTLLTVHLL